MIAAASFGCRRALPALGLAAVLGGCILSTDRPVLGIDIPERYLAGPVRPEAARAAPPALDWWRDFRSSELTALMEEARRVNFDIAAARARILQADAQARIAGAPLLPALNAEANVTSVKSSVNAGGSGRTVTTYTAGLSASYEIDFWGKNHDAALAAVETATASRFDHDVIGLTTLATVANSYFQMLAAQDRLRIARNNIASAKRIYDAIKQRVEAGTATDLELAQQESILAGQRASVPPLQQTFTQNLFALATLVARPPEQVKITGGSLSRIGSPRVTPGLPSELLIQRPDIRRAEAQLASATANVGNARAQFFPSIQLTGQGGYQSTSLATLFRPESVFYNVAASLTQPILDGGRIQGNFDLAQARQDETLQTYRKAIVSAFSDVDTALTGLRTTTERVRLQRQAAVTARRAFNLAEIRLREGTIDIITVLNTQTTVFQAEDLLAQAQLARLQAIVSLYQALGGGWPPDIVVVAARPVPEPAVIPVVE
ncbi:MAG: efflux transporter outer membrane subunit [Xanthobacteraceae bacterium]|nr:MAG: efflux transporter outer membrane subunit [Xanthobacteraceae bacterium]